MNTLDRLSVSLGSSQLASEKYILDDSIKDSKMGCRRVEWQQQCISEHFNLQSGPLIPLLLLYCI